jgi:AAA+ superfamily predicted ATPase
MYVGPAQFANNKEVVGIRLDTKRTTSDCDGKFERERYFRCKPGYGIYLPTADVEVLAADDDEVEEPEVDEGPFDFERALEEMVGQTSVRNALMGLRNLVEVQKKRAHVGVHENKPLHFSVTGSSGTGVTYVCKLLSRLLSDLGVLERGHVVESGRKDLIDEPEKRVEAQSKRAAGGMWVLTNANTLKDPERTDSSGQEVVSEVSKRLESQKRKQPIWPQAFSLALTGPRAEVQTFAIAQGFKVASALELVDFTTDELAVILQRIVKQRKFTLSQGLQKQEVLVDLIRRKGAQQALRGKVKNIHLVQTLLDDAIARQATRVWEQGTISLPGLTTLVEEDFAEPAMAPELQSAADKAFARLDAVVGLEKVKGFVRSLYAQLVHDNNRRIAGIESSSVSNVHMIFSGSPGTGKTTVARIVAELLKSIGWLKSGHLVEVDRSSLVAGYAGQTALKTRAAFDSALGGVLFVDEAYALVQGDKDSFGREALDTLLKLVEDFRGEIVVILAGYSTCMVELLSRNPGLKSRFPTQITFENYSAEEMMQIAEQMLLGDVLVLDAAGTAKLEGLLQKISLGEHSNGRSVRNIVEQAKRNQASRLQSKAKPTKDDLCTLTAADFEQVTLDTE